MPPSSPASALVTLAPAEDTSVTSSTIDISDSNNARVYFTSSTVRPGSFTMGAGASYSAQTTYDKSGNFVHSEQVFTQTLEDSSRLDVAAQINDECVAMASGRGGDIMVACMTDTGHTIAEKKVSSLSFGHISSDGNNFFVYVASQLSRATPDLAGTWNWFAFTYDPATKTISEVAKAVQPVTNSVPYASIGVAAGAVPDFTRNAVAVVGHGSADRGVILATLQGPLLINTTTQETTFAVTGALACPRIVSVSTIDGRRPDPGTWVWRVALTCYSYSGMVREWNDKGEQITVEHNVTGGVLLVVDVDMIGSIPASSTPGQVVGIKSLASVETASNVFTDITETWLERGPIAYREGTLLVGTDHNVLTYTLPDDQEDIPLLSPQCWFKLADSTSSPRLSFMNGALINKYAGIIGIYTKPSGDLISPGPFISLDSEECTVIHAPQNYLSLTNTWDNVHILRDAHNSSTEAIGRLSDSAFLSVGSDGATRVWSSCPAFGLLTHYSVNSAPVVDPESAVRATSMKSTCEACTDTERCFGGRKLPGDTPSCPAHTTHTPTNGSQFCAPEPGYHMDLATLTLKACRRGFYCTGGVAQPEICPLGTFAAAVNPEDRTTLVAVERGATTCVDCPKGYACPKGYQTYCGAGKFASIDGLTYSDSKAHQCVSCIAGNYCPGHGEIYPCGEKEWSPFEAAGCTDCSTSGYYTALASGEWTPTKAPTCPACAAGHKCVSGDKPEKCGSGTFTGDSSGAYTLTGAVDCPACTAGHYCPGDGTKRPCINTDDIHDYSPTSGLSACATCSTSTYADHLLVRTPTLCEYCPHGQYMDDPANESGARGCAPCSELVMPSFCATVDDGVGGTLRVLKTCASNEYRKDNECKACAQDETCENGEKKWKFKPIFDPSTRSGTIMIVIIVILILFVLLVLGGLGYWYYKKDEKSKIHSLALITSMNSDLTTARTTILVPASVDLDAQQPDLVIDGESPTSSECPQTPALILTTPESAQLESDKPTQHDHTDYEYSSDLATVSHTQSAPTVAQAEPVEPSEGEYYEYSDEAPAPAPAKDEDEGEYDYYSYDE